MLHFCHDVGLKRLGPRQNGHNFPDDIFKWISIKISVKFVPKSPINNILAFVQISDLHRLGDIPLSAPMLVN